MEFIVSRGLSEWTKDDSLFRKAAVKNPGSRGGKGYWDAEGWHYGERPKGKPSIEPADPRQTQFPFAMGTVMVAGEPHAELEFSGNPVEDLDLCDSADDVEDTLKHYAAEEIDVSRYLGKNEKVWLIHDEREPLVVEWNGEDAYPTAKGASEWVDEANVEAGADELNEDLSRDFWEGSDQPPLYHATDSENVDAILSEGLGAQHKSRGMTNRHIQEAVFTTTLEQAEKGSYGDAIIEIDTAAMKRDGLTPRLEFEPGHVEYQARSGLAAQLNLDDYSPDETDPGSADPDTVIVHASIPAQYLRRVDKGADAATVADGPYQLAGDVVDGRKVLPEIPNLSSISASLTDYKVLKGVREVPFAAFTQMGKLAYATVDARSRAQELAEAITESREIAPLIVVVDSDGPYVLEGSHRFDALRELGAKSFPALVVIDNEVVAKMDAPAPPLTLYHGAHQVFTGLGDRLPKGINTLGTWLTSSPEAARALYGPYVHKVTLPAGKFYEPASTDFDQAFRDHDLFVSLFGAPKKTKHRRGLPGGKVGDWLTTEDLLFQGGRNDATRDTYFRALRQKLVDQGYVGIRWRSSDIDLRPTDPRHDVYCVFNKEPLAAELVTEHIGDLGDPIAKAGWWKSLYRRAKGAVRRVINPGGKGGKVYRTRGGAGPWRYGTKPDDEKPKLDEPSMPAVVAGKVADQLALPEGGISISVPTGEQPTTGYMVSIEGAEVTRPQSDFDADPELAKNLARSYILKHHEELVRPEHYVGVWHEEDEETKIVTAFLDVSENIQDRKTAAQAGKDRKQKGIYDIKADRTIKAAEYDSILAEPDVREGAGDLRSEASAEGSAGGGGGDGGGDRQGAESKEAGGVKPKLKKAAWWARYFTKARSLLGPLHPGTRGGVGYYSQKTLNWQYGSLRPRHPNRNRGVEAEAPESPTPLVSFDAGEIAPGSDLSYGSGIRLPGPNNGRWSSELNTYVGQDDGVTRQNQRTGSSLRGDKVITPDDPKIPDVVYHVTTNLPAVRDSPSLRAGGVGGLGGDQNDAIVSMTLDRGIAEQLAEDIRLNAEVMKLPRERAVARLTQQAKSEGWGDRWLGQPQFNRDGTISSIDYKAKDWITTYFSARESATDPFWQAVERVPKPSEEELKKISEGPRGKRNPLFFNNAGSDVDPTHVGIVAIPKANLNNGALLVDFDLKNTVGLKEIRSYGDVPLVGATFSKAVVTVSDLATRQLQLTKDLFYMDEEDLPACEDLVVKADLVLSRARIAGELRAVDEVLAKAWKLQGETKIGGVAIAIENRKGSVRTWTNQAGESGSTKMKNAYGYARGSESTDGDEHDVFIGPAKNPEKVWVVTTMSPPDFQEIDEQKSMVGFSSLEAARRAFLTNYSDPRFMGDIRELTFEEWKAELRTTKQAPGLLLIGDVVERPVIKAQVPMPEAPGPAPIKGTDVDHAELATHLASYQEPLNAAVDQLSQLFSGAPVAGRLRETASFVGKLQRKEKPIEEIEDAASIRVTVKSIEEEQAAAERIRRSFEVRSEEDYLTTPKGGLYRGFHFVVVVDGKPIEIQVRTPRQTALADAIHDFSIAIQGMTPPPEAMPYFKQVSDYFAGEDGGEPGQNGTIPPCPPVVASAHGCVLEPGA